MYRLYIKPTCLSKPVEVTGNTNKTLAFLGICLFIVHSESIMFFVVKWVSGWGVKYIESGKTTLYLQIIIILLICDIIIKLLIKMRTIPAEPGNGTPNP